MSREIEKLLCLPQQQKRYYEYGRLEIISCETAKGNRNLIEWISSEGRSCGRVRLFQVPFQ